MPPARIELPTLPPCTGCGRCCESIGLPPFELPNPEVAPWPRGKFGPFVNTDGFESCVVADAETFLMMPAYLRAEHAALVRGLTEDPSGKPCAWLDPATKECRHYEWRPGVCRAWEVGNPGCLAARRGARVLWNVVSPPARWRNPRDPSTHVRRPTRRARLALWWRFGPGPDAGKGVRWWRRWRRGPLRMPSHGWRDFRRQASWVAWRVLRRLAEGW